MRLNGYQTVKTTVVATLVKANHLFALFPEAMIDHWHERHRELKQDVRDGPPS